MHTFVEVEYACEEQGILVILSADAGGKQDQPSQIAGQGFSSAVYSKKNKQSTTHSFL